MLEKIRNFFAPPIFEHEEDKTRTAYLLNVLLWAGIVIFAISGLATYIVAGQVISLLLLSGLIVAYLFLVFAMRRGYVKVVSYLFITAAWLGVTGAVAISGGTRSPSSSAYIAITLMAGLLLGSKVGIFTASLSALTGLAMMYLEEQGILVTAEGLKSTPLSAWITLTVIIAAAITVLILAIQNLNRVIRRMRENETSLKEMTSKLEERVAIRTTELALANESLEAANEKSLERSARLRTIAEISRSFTAIQNMDELLPIIAQRISEAFGFYHTGIFLVDANDEYAVLRAANSEGGQKMLARGHRLKVGQTGIVGFVTGTGRPRIALDVGDDAVFFENPDLPNTRSEMAIPLRASGKVIGAVDFQSIARSAFTSEDIDILTLLVDQISISIQNARLFEDLRLALSEAQTIYNRASRASWHEIARRSSLGYRYANGIVEELRTASTGTPAKASKKTAPASQAGHDPELLAIPISVRGEKLGDLTIRQPGRTGPWGEAEVRLYRSIVERLSFALENARLIEETTNRAQRDRTITEIGDKLSSSARVETILRTAAEELSRVIQGSEVLVQLQPGAHTDNAQ